MRSLYWLPSCLLLAGCTTGMAASLPTSANLPSGLASISNSLPGSESKIGPHDAPRFASLYSFMGGSDGALPTTSMVSVGGKLLGTTIAGGARKSGTVFELSRPNTEHVLYSFKGGEDGDVPASGLSEVGRTLYGTTSGGGLGYGTVFAITADGSERLLYSFTGGADGAFPNGSLTELGGYLYGTTNGAGSQNGSGYGTVFRVSMSGFQTVLYRFKGGADGAYPNAGLTKVNGSLFGTTAAGGPNNAGTVFEIAKSGDEHIIHEFKGGEDGATPYAGLTNVSGTLYGTTAFGGTGIGLGNGTIFKIDTSGRALVIYHFKGGTDGACPQAGLTEVNGMLYGTTYFGGTSGAGTVFQISPRFAERVLHAFDGGAGGANPAGGLTYVSGALYGTTYLGGADGNGTIFSLPL